jgi:hypothetical protein
MSQPPHELPRGLPPLVQPIWQYLGNDDQADENFEDELVDELADDSDDHEMQVEDQSGVLADRAVEAAARQSHPTTNVKYYSLAVICSRCRINRLHCQARIRPNGLAFACTECRARNVSGSCSAIRE